MKDYDDYSTQDNTHYSYSGDGEYQPTHKKKMTPGALIFLIVFLGGIVGAMILCKFDELYAVMCGGLCFLSSAVYALTQQKGKGAMFPIILVGLVGLGMIGVPLLWKYQVSHPEMKPILTEQLGLVAFALVFFGVGVGILIAAFRSHQHRTKCCTVSVQATCIELIRKRSSKGGVLYNPVWEYYFGGQTYTQNDPVSSNVGVPQVGEQVEIMVNPENPTDYYRRGNGEMALLLVIGSIFAVVGLIILIAAIKGAM